MKPYKHSIISVKQFGGEPEDYMAIHDFIDHTKMCIPDVRHRMLLHNAWGVFIVERVFGVNIINSQGHKVSVREIAEQHVLDDLGFIPTLEKCFEGVEMKKWLGGPRIKGKSAEIKAKMRSVVAD